MVNCFNTQFNLYNQKPQRGIAYKGGGGGGLSQDEINAQMRSQEEMMNRQMELQQKYQLEAEERARAERERERQLEFARRETEAFAKKERRTTEERQEAATFAEMTSQSKQDVDDFGAGFELDIPTIDRPGYEQESRPI